MKQRIGRVRLPENVQVDQVGNSRGWTARVVESVARNVAGHQFGGAGVAIRESDDAALQGQPRWRRSFRPRLETVGLDWANFQAMRRTHSSLSSDLGVDPKVGADQMGHGVSTNQDE